MAGAPSVILGTPVTINSAVTSVVVPKQSGVVDGDVIGVSLRAQGVPPNTQDITMPSGWARTDAGNGSTDRAQALLFKPVPSASAEAATSYTFGNFGAGRLVAQPFILRGVDLTDPIVGFAIYKGTSQPVLATNAYDVEDTPYIALVMWGDERVSGQSHIPTSKPAGWTEQANFQSSNDSSTSGSRTTQYLASLSVAEGGSTNVPAASLTWATSSAGNRVVTGAFRGIKATVPTTPIGKAAKNEAGTAVRVSYLNESLQRVAPGFIKPWYPGFVSVQTLLNKAGATLAHRGGSLVWPEMSEIAYDRSVLYGYGALEFSCGWTSDLVPFGFGDQYLDRVAGVTGSVDPTTMTWTQLVANYRNVLRPVASDVTQPFYKLEDFLIKFSGSHVLLVDPKYGFSSPSKVAAMLDLCDAYGGPNKIIIKFDSATTNTVMTTAAHARGYLCMNYWGAVANQSLMDAQQANWDLIGVLYSDAAMLAQANTYGKPVWAAVNPNLAGYTSAVANGADIVMCTDPINIPAVSSWN